MQAYTIPDQHDMVSFTGDRLAFAATDRDAREPRWTEIAIYRTVAGSYVVHKTGKSDVFHRLDGACNRGVRTPWDDLPEEATACSRCWDIDDVEMHTESVATGGTSDVNMELDRHSVTVCLAAEVPEALRHDRQDGVRIMSSVSQRVLEMAVDADKGLRDAVSTVRKVD